MVEKCENILVTMNVLGEESNVENFNKHFYEEQAKNNEPELSPEEILAQKISSPTARKPWQPRTLKSARASTSK